MKRSSRNINTFGIKDLSLTIDQLKEMRQKNALFNGEDFWRQVPEDLLMSDDFIGVIDLDIALKILDEKRFLQIFDKYSRKISSALHFIPKRLITLDMCIRHQEYHPGTCYSAVPVKWRKAVFTEGVIERALLNKDAKLEIFTPKQTIAFLDRHVPKREEDEEKPRLGFRRIDFTLMFNEIPLKNLSCHSLCDYLGKRIYENLDFLCLVPKCAWWKFFDLIPDLEVVPEISYSGSELQLLPRQWDRFFACLREYKGSNQPDFL